MNIRRVVLHSIRVGNASPLENRFSVCKKPVLLFTGLSASNAQANGYACKIRQMLLSQPEN
jgi:hypothetical protein